MRYRRRERTFRRLLYLFLIVRLGLVAVTVSNPTGSLMADSHDYLALAAELVETGSYGIPSDPETDILRPPAYSGLLAGIQLILGSETYNITFIQLVLSSLTCLLILSLGTQLARPTAGLVGAWLYALSPNAALWSLTIMTEVSFAFSLTLIAWISLKAARRSIDTWAVGSGFQLGLLAYLRPIGILLLPAWSIATIWGIRTRTSKRKALVAAAVLTFVGLLTILPWAYRNWSTSGTFTFSTVTTKTWVGFNLAQVVARGEGIDRNTAVGRLNPEVGTLQLTFDIIKNYPIEFAESQFLGVARAAAGIEVGTWGLLLNRNEWVAFGLLGDGGRRSINQALTDAIDWSGESGGVRFALSVYSLLFSLILIGLSIIGILTFRSVDAPERLIISSAIATVLVLLLIPGAAGQARFRVPAEPYLALLAGYGWFALSVRFGREDKSVEGLDRHEDLIHAS